MTIQDAIKEQLVKNGMFDTQADSVIEMMKADDDVLESTKDRWQDDTEGYPPALMGVLMVSAKRHALTWIDANLPLAWYRPLFVTPAPFTKGD